MPIENLVLFFYFCNRLLFSYPLPCLLYHHNINLALVTTYYYYYSLREGNNIKFQILNLNILITNNIYYIHIILYYTHIIYYLVLVLNYINIQGDYL